MELGNIVRDHLPNIPKNPQTASWDAEKMAVNGKNEMKLIYSDISLIIPLK